MSVIGYFDSIYLDFRLPFSLDVAFTAVVFYGLGFILNNSIFLKSVNMYAALICLIIGMLCGYINDRVDMDTMHYGNFFLFYASSISSIYAFIQISKYIPNIKLISYVGKNSLSFFLLQNPAFLFFSMLIYSISRIRVSSCEFTLAYACGYALLSMLLLFPASYIINNKIPIITGKIN
jgi:fucose 4-O-acetylase-like acetyltransferase